MPQAMPPDVVATAGSAATSSTSAATTISSTAPAPDTGASGSPIAWRSLYPVHPCADVFPMMSDEDIEALAADIRDNGLRVPAILWVKADLATVPFYVLDGRNRLEALGAERASAAAARCQCRPATAQLDASSNQSRSSKLRRTTRRRS